MKRFHQRPGWRRRSSGHGKITERIIVVRFGIDRESNRLHIRWTVDGTSTLRRQEFQMRKELGRSSLSGVSGLRRGNYLRSSNAPSDRAKRQPKAKARGSIDMGFYSGRKHSQHVKGCPSILLQLPPLHWIRFQSTAHRQGWAPQPPRRRLSRAITRRGARLARTPSNSGQHFDPRGALMRGRTRGSPR